MKYIELTQGYRVIVDDEDYEWLSNYSWYYHTGYGCRTTNKQINGKPQNEQIRMHREIYTKHYGKIPENIEIDHADLNKLNNSLSNLRAAKRSNNMMNREKFNGDKYTSNFKGLAFRNEYSTSYWRVRLYHDKNYIHVGNFTNEIAAANAYNHYAKIYHGEFALLNDVEYMDDWESYRVIKPDKSSKYNGVVNLKNGKWRATIWINGKTKQIGHFDSEIDAAVAREEYAIELFGYDYDKLNFTYGENNDTVC